MSLPPPPPTRLPPPPPLPPARKILLLTRVLSQEQPCIVIPSGIQPKLLHYLSRYLNRARDLCFVPLWQLRQRLEFLFLKGKKKKLLITLPRWKQKLIPLDGIL